MAVDLIFTGSLKSKSEEHKLEVNCTEDNEILIEIETEGSDYGWISLDRETAIKFSKELRKQISNIPY